MPSTSSPSVPGDDEQRRRNVRLAIWLLGVALVFYFGFILLSVYRSHAGS